jgi:hypothetical protein
MHSMWRNPDDCCATDRFRLSEVHRLQGQSAFSPFVFVSERGSSFTTAGLARMIERTAAVPG